GGALHDAQGYVGGGAGRRRRVRFRGFEDAVGRGAGLAAGLRVEPDDLTCVVDAPRIGERYGRGIVDVGVQAAAIEEAVGGSVGSVSPYDLAQIVDAIGKCGARDGPRNIDGGEGAAAVEEGVKNVVLVRVPADDLACVVDALCDGDTVYRGGQRIIEGGVGAAATRVVEKAVDGAAIILVRPDDLTQIVDRLWLGVIEGQRIVEGDGEA